MLRYRPFMDGPWRLSMGLRALDPDEWIEIDDRFALELAERRWLFANRSADVFAALPESGPGQQEVLELLLDHLTRRFPETYRAADGAIANLATGEQFLLDDFAAAPLDLAGRLIQEDLCLMQRDASGYRLVAAALCFPLHWRLADKLGRPLAAIHDPVPGFADGLAATVDRFFANIRVEHPVWRANWSLVDTPARFLPPEHRGKPPRIDAVRAGDQLWLRVERQTLRRLPRTGDVLFTIRTYVESLAEAVDTPAAARALAERVRELPPPVAAYKGILPIRAPLLGWLDRRAGESERAA